MKALAIGTTLGSYRITGRIGAGGGGEVWKAVDVALDRLVAVKALRADRLADAAEVERFREEARTLARLDHPNVAVLHALLEEAGALFMVMEYVDGETFAARLRRGGALALDDAFALFHQALDGVAHAHAAGVVHRDLKSSNLMVSRRGVVKVMDFGIARVGGARRLTRAGKLVGTPEYVAPEQVRGEPATLRSDVYSLGIVLYELLTGRLPFRGGAEFEVLRAHLETPPQAPATLGVELPPGLEDALLRALEKQPERRFPGVRAFQEALVAAGAPAPDTTPSGRLAAQAGVGAGPPAEVPPPGPPGETVPHALGGSPVAGTPPGPTRVLELAGAEPAPREEHRGAARETATGSSAAASASPRRQRGRWPLWAALAAMLALAAAGVPAWLRAGPTPEAAPGAPAADGPPPEPPAPAPRAASEPPAPTRTDPRPAARDAAPAPPVAPAPARRRAPAAEPDPLPAPDAAGWEFRR
jgi:serine/threonine-protein kinase